MQAKVSDMTRCEFANLSERMLMDCLTRLGYDIEIKRAPRQGQLGIRCWPLRKVFMGAGICLKKMKIAMYTGAAFFLLTWATDLFHENEIKNIALFPPSSRSS